MKTPTNNMIANLKDVSRLLDSRFWIACLFIFTASAAKAGVITSSDFSFGYGFTNTGWTVQTPSDQFTQGNFTMSPTVSGGVFSENGPIFTDRILADGLADWSGWSNGFSLELSAQWNGPTPPDAANNPNYTISLIIESISIYGTSAQPDGSVNALAIGEITAGHVDSSTPVSLTAFQGDGTFYNLAANYTPVSWTPNDFSVLGTNVDRSFNLISTGGTYEAPVDGLQIFGRIVVTYDSIPEPSTGVLMIAGGGLVLLFKKRRSIA